MKNIKTIEIYSVAFGGEGVGKINGKVCFVRGALPGEKAVIEITEESLFESFFVPPYSFFQVNIFAYNLLLSEFKKILGEVKRETIFDL